MANKIKNSADGIALQVTREVREARLVEEDSDDDLLSKASIRVYAFDDFLLVVDTDELSDAEIAHLVILAARDTESIHTATDSSITTAGNGYQIQLQPGIDAGFHVGDKAPCIPGPNILCITKDKKNTLATRLIETREDQIDVDVTLDDFFNRS